MKMTDFLLAELDREVDRSRRAIDQVPEGQHDWKPHDRSMPFGYLVQMVATIPSWIAMIVSKDELDIAPTGGSSMDREPKKTRADLTQALEKTADEARTALGGTTEEHLMTPWRLKAHGGVVQAAPRFEMIQDAINHWAHHRGQMTVYLRLMGAKVPALYGPSADDQRFG